MKCPKCDSDSRKGVNSCEECGAKFELVCPSRIAKMPLGKKFCRECDQSLSLPSEYAPQEFSFDHIYKRFKNTSPKFPTEKILFQRNRIEGERKQVTAMFYNMESFTPLSELLGIYATYTNMDQVYEILIHKAHDFEGVVCRSFPVF